MNSVAISRSLQSILSRAAHNALARHDDLRVDDLLIGLLDDPFGARVAPALLPSEQWPHPETTAESRSELSLYLDESLIAFAQSAHRLFALGAERVLLGEYEPRHLAQAIGEMSVTTRAPFARFGLDPLAWRRALSKNP